MFDRFRGAPLDAGLFRSVSISRATPACPERFQHLSGLHGQTSSNGSPSTQRNQALRRPLSPRDQDHRAKTKTMMGKHEHSFRQKGNGEVVPTPAPAGHAVIVLVRQVEPDSRLRAAFYLK